MFPMPDAHRSRDDDVLPWRPGAPPPDLTPAEFEQWVAELCRGLWAGLDDLRVEIHDRIQGTDGTYDFDVTGRWRIGGADYLTLVEAKQHRNPIKREVVQVLLTKARSVGAQKAMLVSTAPFQRGAIRFAGVHGIALISVTEGRLTYETRSVSPTPVLSAEQAAALGIPRIVGHLFEATNDTTTTVTLVEAEQPQRLREALIAHCHALLSPPASRPDT
jgi:hypothetical protein